MPDRNATHTEKFQEVAKTAGTVIVFLAVFVSFVMLLNS